MRGTPQPVAVGLPEKAKPGSDGQITWNASSALPPCAVGSTSGPMTLWNSTIEPGQPCVISSGRACGCGERWWMKCTSSPSSVVMNWSKRFSSTSRARQS